MKPFFVTRARMDREVAAVCEAARLEAEQEAARHARQLAEAAAANKRLDDRRRELGRRLDLAHDKELGELGDITLLEGRAARAEARVRRLEKVLDRVAAGARTNARRAEHLQDRLDDACGLNDPAIEARRIVQARPVKEDAS